VSIGAICECVPSVHSRLALKVFRHYPIQWQKLNSRTGEALSGTQVALKSPRGRLVEDVTLAQAGWPRRSREMPDGSVKRAR